MTTMRATSVTAKAFSSSFSAKKTKTTTTKQSKKRNVFVDGSLADSTKRGPKPTRAVAKGKTEEVPKNLERLRILTPWEEAQKVLKSEFGTSDEDLKSLASYRRRS